MTIANASIYQQSLAHCFMEDGQASGTAQGIEASIKKVVQTNQSLQWQQQGRALYQLGLALNNTDHNWSPVQPLKQTFLDLFVSLSSLGAVSFNYLFPHETITTLSHGVDILFNKLAPFRLPCAYAQSSPAPMKSAAQEREITFLREDDQTVQSQNSPFQASHIAVLKQLKRRQYLVADSAPTAQELIKAVIQFSQDDIHESRNIIARTIQNSLGEYGGHGRETLTETMQKAIVQSWLEVLILGDSIENFIAKKIVASDKSSNFFNHNIIYFLKNAIHSGDAECDEWIWQHVVSEALPLLDELSAHNDNNLQSAQLQHLRLDDFEWGQMHAGLLLARHAGLSSADLTPSQAGALGKMLLMQLREATVPREWWNFFKLPAKLRYAIADHAMLEMEGYALLAYANDYDDYLQTHCPVTRFNNGMTRYKTRPQLAQEVINRECPGMDLTDYLNAPSGQGSYCQTSKQVRYLDNITQKYQQQIDDIGDAFLALDCLLVSATWVSLAAEEIDFLRAAEITYKQAQFSAAHVLNRSLMGANALARESLTITMKKDVTLFSAQAQYEGRELERIYALQKQPQGYHIKRVDRDRAAYCALAKTDHRDIFNDADFLLQINRLGKVALKTRAQALPVLFEKIAQQHQVDFTRQLHAYGFKKTGLEQFIDFSLSLIPFYTCVTAAQDGRVDEAALACSIDVLTLIPVLGNLSNLSIKFGQALARGGITTMRHATAEMAAHAALKAALQQGGRDFFQHALLPASQTISRQELATLGITALRALDPGLELLSSISRSTLHQATQLGAHMKSSLPELTDVLEKLQQTLKTMPDDILPEAHIVARLPETNREVAVVRLGGDQWHGAVYVRVNPETGAIFGNKYALKQDGSLEYIPLNLARRLRNIREQGLSGREAPQQGKKWALEAPDDSVMRAIERWNANERARSGAQRSASHSSQLPLAVAHDATENQQAAQQAVNYIEEQIKRSMHAPAQAAEKQQARLQQPASLAAQAAATSSSESRQHASALLKSQTQNKPLHAQATEAQQRTRQRLLKLANASSTLQKLPPPLRPNQHVRINGRHLEQWLDMDDRQRNEYGMENFVRENQLDLESWKFFVRTDGTLTIRGEDMLARLRKQFAPITAEHLKDWQAKQLVKRTYTNTITYARIHNLNPEIWVRHVTNNGHLTPRGKSLLAASTKHTPAPALEMPGEKQAVTESENINNLRRADSPDLSIVKVEADTAIAVGPQYRHDNHLPVLQQPGNPGVSILAEAEGNIEGLRISSWGADLHAVFSTMPQTEQRRVKAAILQDAKQWLQNTEHYATQLDDMVEIKVPLDDGPLRGDSLFSRREIGKFTVLGPYAGTLHVDNQSLRKEIRKHGETPVLRYLWATKSDSRSVSGLTHGNVLRLMNTARLPGAAENLGKNNVAAVQIGKNLTFYVALRDIKTGEELLIDYGPSYAPQGKLIKQELPAEGERRR